MNSNNERLPEKYRFRTEQLMHYIFLCGEVPSTLYKQLHITNGNFRAAICSLRKQGYIKSVKANGMTGYVLTPYTRKNILNTNKYFKYKELCPTYITDLKRRKRMRSFVELYSVFDRIGIEYDLKDNLTKNALSSITNNLIFYTAQEFKQTQNENGVAIKGSRCYGLLAGKQKVIPVYKTNYELQEYQSVETLLRQLLESYFGVNVSGAVMICDNAYACKNICNSFINFSAEKNGKDLTSYSMYRNLYIVPEREHFKLQIWTIYNQSTIRKQIENSYKITQRKTFIINDGFIGKTPVLFQLVIEIARLKPYLANCRTQNTEGIIVCYDFMLISLKEISTGLNIKFISVKSDSLERKIINATL